jgi:hypothetical protein
MGNGQGREKSAGNERGLRRRAERRARRVGLHRPRQNIVRAGLDGVRRRLGAFAVQRARLDHGKDEQDGPGDGVGHLPVDVASAGVGELKSAQRTPVEWSEQAALGFRRTS